MERDYDVIRDHISQVIIPGFEWYNEDVRRRDGFVLPNGPRDSRTFRTATAKAQFSANVLEAINDRYRGIKKGRDVVFVNPDDLVELGLADGDRVDVVSQWPGEPDRVLPNQRIGEGLAELVGKLRHRCRQCGVHRDGPVAVE